MKQYGRPAIKFHPDRIRAQLAKIRDSPHFIRSSRMTRFLTFTVGMLIDGRQDELKEYLIGVEVFDRKPEYDPRVDPIVRVEARRLRGKLHAYYESDGRDDDVIIEFAPGGYIPTFRDRGTRSNAKPAEYPRTTIAVLPFQNLSTEIDTEYFSDGLTEELIHRLTKVEGLRAVAWHSTAQLKGRDLDLQEIGERLKAGTILTGKVRRAGEDLRISAQLIDASSGQYLWSETYDRKMKDVFAVQEEIARAITHTLRVRLTGSHVSKAPTQNLEAYSLYLRGRFHWNKRNSTAVERSIELYRQALSLDPDMAVCYAGIADSYTILAEYGFLRPAEVADKARPAAERALALNPLLAEPHASLALIRSEYEWDWREAEQLYRRALQLDPGYASTHHWFAVDYLGVLGRIAEAQEHIELAVQLDPLSPVILEGKGYLYLLNHEYDRALEVFHETQQLDPTFIKAWSSIGRALIQQARAAEAIGWLQRSRQIGGDVPNVLAALAQAHALTGNQDQARALLDHLGRMAEHRYMPSTAFAVVHLALGEMERALEWLERGLQCRDLSLVSLYCHPVYDPLRGDPRFDGLLAAIFSR